MSILIDHRAGSEELVSYPPFNTCPICSQPISITRCEIKKQRRIESAVCSLNPSHRLLGTLTSLARFNRDSKTSPDVYFTGNGPNDSDRPNARDSKLTFAIEIKSISNLLGDIISGKLAATQIPHLLTYDKPWIVWYGSVRQSRGLLQVQRWDHKSHSYRWFDFLAGRRTFPYSYLENFLDSPAITDTHLRVKQYRSMADIAYWIGACYYPLWQKPYSSHKSLNRFDDSARIPSSHLLPHIDDHTYQLMLYAAANPSINFARATNIALHFDSAQDMFNADASEWAEIKIRSKSGREVRLGPVRAQAIVNAIRRRRSK